MEDDGRAGGLSRPLTVQEQERLAHLDRLKFFLATAPSRWSTKQEDDPDAHHLNPSHPALNRFLLPNQEYVSCVLWNGLYHITGTDIVRALVFRFEAFGRPVKNMKKFEEGVFSDLRNLKPGMDACLEEPKASVYFSHSAVSPYSSFACLAPPLHTLPTPPPSSSCLPIAFYFLRPRAPVDGGVKSHRIASRRDLRLALVWEHRPDRDLASFH